MRYDAETNIVTCAALRSIIRWFVKGAYAGNPVLDMRLSAQELYG
jgi:hypothetical protein